MLPSPRHGLLVEVVEVVLELAELLLEVGVELREDPQQARVGRELLAHGPLAESHLESSLVVFFFFNSDVNRVVVFKASALWADAFYKSKCPYVFLCVCVSVCLSVCSLLRYRLTVFLPPLPEVGCPICSEIRNPWGKVMERSGLTFENVSLEVV